MLHNNGWSNLMNTTDFAIYNGRKDTLGILQSEEGKFSYQPMKGFILKEEEEVCRHFRGDLMGDFAQNAIPILFPFVIEYVLIGASVALIMANHIGR